MPLPDLALDQLLAYDVGVTAPEDLVAFREDALTLSPTAGRDPVIVTPAYDTLRPTFDVYDVQFPGWQA